MRVARVGAVGYTAHERRIGAHRQTADPAAFTARQVLTHLAGTFDSTVTQMRLILTCVRRSYPREI